MSGIKLITLDLDNTLWDVDRIIIAAEKAMLAWLGENVPASLPIYQSDKLIELRNQVVNNFPEQTHDLSFMRIQVLTLVMRQAGLSPQRAQQAAEQAFAIFFTGRNQVSLFPGAQAMLSQLASQYQLYALTNGNADIHRAGIGQFFAGAFSSAQVGQKKPHADMFNAPLQELDLDPAQAIHIGDHLTDDIQGAQAVGMHSIWVNLDGQQASSEDIQPSQEVTHLRHVLQAVERINTP